MIITKAPLRISLMGGGCDYPEYYEKYGCFLFGGTINKHVYVSFRIRPAIMSDKSVVSYSRQEIVSNNEHIVHPLIRETLKHYEVRDSVDIHTFSDIPSRTGLGGSSAFCVALIKAIESNLFSYCSSPQEIAKKAIELERKILKEPGGVQDQLWAAYGGLNTIEIEKNGITHVRPIPYDSEDVLNLEQHLTLIYTGEARNDNTIAQSYRTFDKEQYLSNIHKLAVESYESFCVGNYREFGGYMKESWQEKAKISSGISSSRVREITDILDSYEVYGYKLLGTGGGGFVLSLADPFTTQKIKEQLGKKNILEFKFTHRGTNVAFSEDNND